MSVSNARQNQIRWSWHEWFVVRILFIILLRTGVVKNLHICLRIYNSQSTKPRNHPPPSSRFSLCSSAMQMKHIGINGRYTKGRKMTFLRDIWLFMSPHRGQKAQCNLSCKPLLLLGKRKLGLPLLQPNGKWFVWDYRRMQKRWDCNSHDTCGRSGILTISTKS